MDGFKNVHRRILQGAREMCPNKNIKCATLDGYVVGHYHPHGSCWDPMVIMVREGYLTGKGNFGSSLGVSKIPPAASRYPEIRLSKISEILFMNYLLDYVPMVSSEIGYDEYEYLPSLIPGIFMGATNETSLNTSMGVHIKCVYPKFEVSSILDYIIEFIKNGKWDDNIPVLKFHNILIQNKQFVTKSSFDATFSAHVKKDGKEYHILSILPNKNMENLLSSIPYKDLTTVETDISIPEKYYDESMFSSEVKYNSLAYVEDEDNPEGIKIFKYDLKSACKIQILKINDLMRKHFEFKIKYYSDKLSEYEKIKKIRSEMEKNKSKDIFNMDSLNEEERSLMREHRISTMLDIDKKIEDTKNTLKNFKDRSKNISKEVLDLYLDAKNVVASS